MPRRHASMPLRPVRAETAADYTVAAELPAVAAADAAAGAHSSVRTGGGDGGIGGGHGCRGVDLTYVGAWDLDGSEGPGDLPKRARASRSPRPRPHPPPSCPPPFSNPPPPR